MANPLLSIKNLSVSVLENSQKRLIVNNLTLEVKANSIFSLVGGSGSGKTTTGLAIMRLLAPALRIESGSICFESESNNLLDYNQDDMRKIRGKKIGMVFQEPLEAFNPVFRIGYQIDEVLKYHTVLTKRERDLRIDDLLSIVGLTHPQLVARSYPHQLSGGMRQRAMIAQAIAADPQLIIADEPTSNLDVTLQARIIELFQELKERLKLSILLITHDLGVVKHLSDEVYVMTQGKIVESGQTGAVLNNPQHEYTQNLTNALNL